MKHILFSLLLLAGNALFAQNGSWSNKHCDVTYDTGAWMVLSEEPGSLILMPAGSMDDEMTGTKILIINVEAMPPNVSSLEDYIAMLKGDIVADESTKIESEEYKTINGQKYKMMRMNMLDEETSERVVIQMAVTVRGDQVVALAYGTEAANFATEWPAAEKVLSQIKWL